MLDQRRRRWAGVVQMLYKCFVFAGIAPYFPVDVIWRNASRDSNYLLHLINDTGIMSTSMTVIDTYSAVYMYVPKPHGSMPICNKTDENITFTIYSQLIATAHVTKPKWWPNVGSMLGYCLRREPRIQPAPCQRLSLRLFTYAAAELGAVWTSPAGWMLGHRLQCWPTIQPAVGSVEDTAVSANSFKENRYNFLEPAPTACLCRAGLASLPRHPRPICIFSVPDVGSATRTAFIYNLWFRWIRRMHIHDIYISIYIYNLSTPPQFSNDNKKYNIVSLKVEVQHIKRDWRTF